MQDNIKWAGKSTEYFLGDILHKNIMSRIEYDQENIAVTDP